jgi:hypothetical protein
MGYWQLNDDGNDNWICGNVFSNHMILFNLLLTFLGLDEVHLIN